MKINNHSFCILCHPQNANRSSKKRICFVIIGHFYAAGFLFCIIENIEGFCFMRFFQFSLEHKKLISTQLLLKGQLIFGLYQFKRMFYQQGGIIKTNVSQQAQMFVNSHVQQINSIFATFNNAYGVLEQSVQNMGMIGFNHYLHIVGQQDAMYYTITVHVPNNGMPIIIESNRGIMNHCPGYGQQYGAQGFIFIPNNIDYGHKHHHGHHHHVHHHGHHRHH